VLNTSLGGGDVKVKSRSFGWTWLMVKMGNQERRMDFQRGNMSETADFKTENDMDDTTVVNLKEVCYEDRN
jgi:hypothetical protein